MWRRWSILLHKVYKKCPKLLRRLWNIMRNSWAEGTIPSSWRPVQNEEGSSTTTPFRTISLLNVECKIFFSMLAITFNSYMVQSHYINISMQKCIIPGFSGCLDHTSKISQLIQEAKQKEGDQLVVLLDLAYTYGPIPHDLIQVGLNHYYIPLAIQDMIASYLWGFKLKFTSAHKRKALKNWPLVDEYKDKDWWHIYTLLKLAAEVAQPNKHRGSCKLWAWKKKKEISSS